MILEYAKLLFILKAITFILLYFKNSYKKNMIIFNQLKLFKENFNKYINKNINFQVHEKVFIL
jgi:hypothetical protein